MSESPERKITVEALIESYRSEYEATIADLQRRLAEAGALRRALEAENEALRNEVSKAKRKAAADEAAAEQVAQDAPPEDGKAAANGKGKAAATTRR